MKREIPMIITFVVCALLLCDYILNVAIINAAAARINDFTSIVATFAMVLGLASLASVHINRIYRKRENWVYSVILIAGFIFAVIAAGLYGVDKTYDVQINLSQYEQLKSEDAAGLSVSEAYFLKLDGVKYEVSKAMYDIPSLPPEVKSTELRYSQTKRNLWFDGLVFEGIYDPLQATMFSLLAFFMASAAYRAFRAKTTEATLLLFAAFLVMLGRVPIGAEVGSLIDAILPFLPGDGSTWFGDISGYIMTVLNATGQRAIMIGAALGMVAASVRIWIGLESEHLGRD